MAAIRPQARTGFYYNILLRDTFTGTDGTLLSAHTPETGGPWVNSFGTWDLGGNKSRLFANGGGDSCNVAQVDTGKSSVLIVTNWVIGNPNGYFGNSFNYSSQTDFWSWRYNTITGDLSLTRRVSNVDTNVVTVSGLSTYAGGETLTTSLNVAADTVQLSINGAALINYNVTGRPLKTLNKHGLFNFIANDGQADTITIYG